MRRAARQAAGSPYCCGGVRSSASRAALLQAWDEYKMRREWFARDFCQPVYETWLSEAVAIGRVEAPGFFEDPMLRAAWSNANWHGPVMSILDPVKDADGSNLRVQYGLSTRAKEAAEMTGTDWEENVEQLAYEISVMKEKGIPMQTADASDWAAEQEDGDNQRQNSNHEGQPFS